MLFASCDKLMSFSNNHKILITIIASFFVLGTLLLHLDGTLNSYKGIAILLESTSGLMLFLSIISIYKLNRKSTLLKWMSEISYEVYLIHLTAIMFVKVLLPELHPLLFFSISVLIIIFSSFLLHIVCKKINNVILRKV